MRMELWEAIVFQLFILSVISERITNFIKLNLQSVTELMGNFRLHESDSKKEKKREQGIVNWAIAIGVLVAVFSKADLFYLIENGEPSRQWKDISIIGVVLTGCFLSLGSKFWHDLLDLLLQIKNLKSKLNDRQEMEFNRIEEVDAYMNSYEVDLIKKVLEDRQAEIISLPQVRGIGIKSDSEGFYCEVAVIDNSVMLPQNLIYNYPPGRIKFLRFKKIFTSEIVTLNKRPVQPGIEIGGATTKGISGTLGCIVRYKNSNLPVLLTCYHVVKSPNQAWEVFDASMTERVEHPNDRKLAYIGKVKEAKRNLRVDVAVIDPDLNTIELLATSPGFGSIKSHRYVTKEDQDRNTIVNKYGKVTGSTSGRIDSIGYVATIRYLDGSQHTLYNLIRIKPLSGEKPFSRPGDSGSIVVDTDGQAIGMVVAGTDDHSFSYAVPIATIFNEFNLEF